MVSSISSFPMPIQPTLSDIRAWLGLVNQVAPFLVITEIMKPFRDLLKGNSKTVYWDDYLQQCFLAAKEQICRLIAHGLISYDKLRKTVLITDWSRDGIGFLLLQQHCQCISDTPFCCNTGWKLIYCSSRSLTSVPEGEAPAITWALKRAKMFLLGHPGFIIITDHRPLTRIFGDKEFSSINNPRLLRLKEKTLMYHFQTIHNPGNKDTAANTLSRYPLKVCQVPIDEHDIDGAVDSDNAITATIAGIAMSNDTLPLSLERLREAAHSDPPTKNS